MAAIYDSAEKWIGKVKPLYAVVGSAEHHEFNDWKWHVRYKSVWFCVNDWQRWTFLKRSRDRAMIDTRNEPGRSAEQLLSALVKQAGHVYV